MSIYGTSYVFHVEDEGSDDELIEVVVQLVPAWITYEGAGWEFLPPARHGIAEEEGYLRPRAAVFCAPWTTKGTERCGQEYVDPLFTLSGEEWERLSFREVMERITNTIAAHFGADE